jgi:hypothetical protein
MVKPNLLSTCVKVAFIHLRNVPDPVIVRTMGIDAIAGYMEAHLPPNTVEMRYWQISSVYFENDVKACTVGLSQFAPQIIAVSVHPDTVEIVYRFLPVVIETYATALIVMGGVVPTYAYHELLQLYPSVIMGTGEGEETMVGLIRYLQGQASLSSVPNIAYLEQTSRKLTLTQQRVLDLRQVHYLPSTLSIEKKKGLAHKFTWIESSRGCMYDCTFCSQFQQGRREFPVERIFRELCLLYDEFGVRKFIFSDDLFFVKPLRAIELAQAILKRGLKISLEVDARIDTFYKPDEPANKAQLRQEAWWLFKEAGLKIVFFGLESGANSQLERYRKRLDVATMEKGLVEFEKLSILYHAGFIFFDPFMDVREARENLAFLRRTNVHYHVSDLFKEFRVERGTPYLETMRQHNLIKGLTDNLVNYHFEYKNPWVRDLCLSPSRSFINLSSHLAWIAHYDNDVDRDDIVTSLGHYHRQVKDAGLDLIEAYLNFIEAGQEPGPAKTNFDRQVQEIGRNLKQYVLSIHGIPSVVDEEARKMTLAFVDNIQMYGAIQDPNFRAYWTEEVEHQVATAPWNTGCA